MDLKVYWISGSPYCWSILLLLETKGVDYISLLLSADENEHKSAAFLRLNPRGSVPVLRDGDLVVRESLAILVYLESRFPDRPMFGQNPEETARVWQSISEFNSYIVDPMYSIASMIFRGTALTNRDEVERLVAQLTPEFRSMDMLLGNTSFLAGDNFTAADIVAYPRLAHFLLAITDPGAHSITLKYLPFREHYPSISRWMERIEKFPYFQSTFPPHWRRFSVSAC